MSLQDSLKPRPATANAEARLRLALVGDCGFRWAFYSSSMRTLLEALGAWDEKKPGKGLQRMFQA